MGGSPERVEFRRMAIVFDDRVDFVARGDGEFGEMLCDFSASSKDCERDRHCECVWSKKDKMVMGIYTRWLWIFIQRNCTVACIIRRIRLYNTMRQSGGGGGGRRLSNHTTNTFPCVLFRTLVYLTSIHVRYQDQLLVR